MENNENVVRYYEANQLTLKEIDWLGSVMAASGRFVDVQSKAQAVVQIIAGQELGFSPMISMTKIHVIKGKVTISAELMASMIKRTGDYDYKVVEHDEKKCVLQFYHNNEKDYLSTFTIEDAKRAGVYKPGSGWEKYPRAMLFSRALSQGARIACPHILTGAYTHEEMGAEVNEGGEILDISSTGISPNPEKVESPPEEVVLAEEASSKKEERIENLKITPAQWTELCKMAMKCKDPDGKLMEAKFMFETAKNNFRINFGTDLTSSQIEIIKNKWFPAWEQGSWEKFFEDAE